MDHQTFYQQIATAMAAATGRTRWFFTEADFKIASQLLRSEVDIRCILKAIQQASSMPSCRPDALTLHFVCNFQRLAKYQKLIVRSQQGMTASEPVLQQLQPADIQTHLRNLVRLLRGAANSCQIHARNVLLSAAARLDRIQATASYPQIENELASIQTTLDSQLLELLSNEERRNFYAASTAALRDFSKRVTSQVFDEMLARSMIKMARKKYNAPKLSLF